MEPIAVYFGEMIIYWRHVIIFLGMIAGCMITLALYYGRERNRYIMAIYFPLTLLFSLILGRVFHWYCYMEQYDGFKDAMTNFAKGDFLIPGVLFAVWMVAFALGPFTRSKSHHEMLDAIAPGLAFILALVRLSDAFTDGCRGKMLVQNKMFQHLPFAIASTDSAGNVEYRFAAFMVSFICLLVITVLLIIFYVKDAGWEKKAPLKTYGHTFRLFLVLYGGMEVVIDSIRYDAAHLSFPGEVLASLNKGASFMGLSQFLGALFCVYVVAYYLMMSTKANKSFKGNIIPLIIFVLGIGIGGVSEYLVQRYSGMYVLWYGTQILGVFMIIVSIAWVYGMCIKKPEERSR